VIDYNREREKERERERERDLWEGKKKLGYLSKGEMWRVEIQ
jgi:hypothetical protein